ncbi:hypothetical protein D9758_004053 [Tetrapyrgos nigripes]|uniref:Homeobox domain-containing protein n=1 Tax=Tetrapyrgos nigripes TaxID=182062 RepID=A0A8H5GL72_9AGAR|nr:hypothetical protein D9758_004053 [Tetrapyrgos nigripes]
MPVTRSTKRSSLHLDPNVSRKSPDEEALTPISATTGSPANMSPSSSSPEAFEGDNDGDIAGTCDSTSSGARSREKKKRCRVTPEQLVHLERYFVSDRSPTAARRREISELLGMQERQTQIWFQNRRAKAKMLDGKLTNRQGTDTPPDTPSFANATDVDVYNLLHEDEPITLIPCTDLSIGTWRRIATSLSKHDLIAYVCESKRCLTWFILSGGNGFKMDIPFESIREVSFRSAAAGTGVATFSLSEPPHFHLEQSAPRMDGKMSLSWKQCSDWTEGAQATVVLRHELLGPMAQLSRLVHGLNNIIAPGNVRLQSPSYHTNTVPTMDIPVPPMAGLTPSFPCSSTDSASDMPADPTLSTLSLTPMRPAYSGISRSMPSLSIPLPYDLPSQDSSPASSLLPTPYDDIRTRLHPAYGNDMSILQGPYSAVSTSQMPRFFSEDVSIAQSLQGGSRRHSWNPHSGYLGNMSANFSYQSLSNETLPQFSAGSSLCGPSMKYECDENIHFNAFS